MHRKSETRAGNRRRHTRTRNASPATQANNAARAANSNPPTRPLYMHLARTPWMRGARLRSGTRRMQAALFSSRQCAQQRSSSTPVTPRAGCRNRCPRSSSVTYTASRSAEHARSQGAATGPAHVQQAAAADASSDELQLPGSDSTQGVPAAPSPQHTDGDSLAQGDDHPGAGAQPQACLLYTSPSPRDRQKSRMPSSA